MSEGYIYVLSNEYLVGLLKIGYTEKPIEETVQELSSSASIPTPFKCAYWAKATDVKHNGQRIHQQLSNKHLGRDFFHITVETAQHLIVHLLGSHLISEKKLPRKKRGGGWRPWSGGYSFSTVRPNPGPGPGLSGGRFAMLERDLDEAT